MGGGYKNINGTDGVRFKKGDKAAEKWTEKEALKFGNDLLNWMQSEDENIFFDDFIFLHDHKNKYAGKIYADLPAYLGSKFSSFFELLQKCKKIEETKLRKFSAFDKLNPQIAKFLLSAQFGITEKQQLDVNLETTKKDLENIFPKRKNGKRI